jgi:hypothetical protein
MEDKSCENCNTKNTTGCSAYTAEDCGPNHELWTAMERQAIGCMIAQRITSALTGMGIPYQELADIVYKECLDIAREMEKGDWIEMPNGDCFTKTFSMKQWRNENEQG